MYSVVATEVMQFFVMTIACIAVAWFAMNHVSAAQIEASVPHGWFDIVPRWNTGLDWTGIFDQVNRKVAEDGYGMLGAMVMMMFFKGIFSSLAGPVPSYDMQRVLSTETPVSYTHLDVYKRQVLFYLIVTVSCTDSGGYKLGDDEVQWKEPPTEQPSIPVSEKPKILWIDASANFEYLANSKENIRNTLVKAKNTGFTEVVVDVRPTCGDVLYESNIVEQIKKLNNIERTATWDYLGTFIEEAHNPVSYTHLGAPRWMVNCGRKCYPRSRT